MIPRAPRLWAIALLAWLPAQSAMAWGPLGHGLIAQRAFSELAPNAPWLTPHRDAFDWGCVCVDINEVSGDGFISQVRTHSDEALKSLWGNAKVSRERAVEAFVLGWAVHVGADQVFDEYCAETGLMPSAEASLQQHYFQFVTDVVLLPRSGQTLERVGRSAAMNYGSPTSEAIADLLEKVFALDRETYRNYAKTTAESCLQRSDRFVAIRSRRLRVGPEFAQNSQTRDKTANMTPWLTRAVNQGVARARSLLTGI